MAVVTLNFQGAKSRFSDVIIATIEAGDFLMACHAALIRENSGLTHYRNTETQFHIALAYEVSQSTVCPAIGLVEIKLVQCSKFHLFTKRSLLNNPNSIQTVKDNVSKQPMEQAKKIAAALQ